MRRVADPLDGVQQVIHLAAHFVQPGLHRIDPFVGVFAALAELRSEFVRERLQIFERHDVIEQVIDHGLIQSLQADRLSRAALTV
ncbi:MAG TPA: hypothetical protein PKD09_19075 [Aggregatilinea sp.]|uniref:hypothetical protein n=1 Tax=Aggregatilinea sp. TaxID=2806333 RepID=UPI002C993D05|nr:hypothetical protein [Aggregatilinea sp.]HML23767.1 hypothetical protein [Aggregatilinea sp.]